MGNQLATEIVQGVTVFKFIHWMQMAWEEVMKETIEHCFEKCGFGSADVLAEETLDTEFNDLVKELCPDLTETIR